MVFGCTITRAGIGKVNALKCALFASQFTKPPGPTNHQAKQTNMVFGVEQATRLVAWTVFVYWEFYRMGNKRVRMYDDNRQRLGRCQIPSGWFPFIWTLLKALMIASIYFYMEYTEDVTNWSFYVVFGLFFALTLLSKVWTPLFFEYEALMSAFVLAFLLAGMSTAIVIIMGVANYNTGTLWYVPLVLMILPAAWYIIAVMLTYMWWRSTWPPSNGSELYYDMERQAPHSHQSHHHHKKHHHHHNKQQQQQPHALVTYQSRRGGGGGGVVILKEPN